MMKLFRTVKVLSDAEITILRKLLNIPINALKFNNHHERYITNGIIESFQPAEIVLFDTHSGCIQFSNEFALLSGGNNYHYWHKLNVKNIENHSKLIWHNSFDLRNIKIKRIDVYSVSTSLIILKEDNFPIINNYVKNNLKLDIDEYELNITTDELLVFIDENNNESLMACKDSADCSIEYSNNVKEVIDMLSLKINQSNQLKYNYRFSIE